MEQPKGIENMKGVYCLVIYLEKDRELEIGALGTIKFMSGYYLYVGSAQSGLEARINRHMREQKRVHWHIDYLLRYSKIIDVWIKEGDKDEECSCAHQLEEYFDQVKNFGCSDCNCSSHLFYHPVNKTNLHEVLKNIFEHSVM